MPVWHEPDEPAHPLRGIAAALRRAAGRPVLVVACDMPFLPPGLLAAPRRSATRRSWCPRPSGRLHPLCARYDARLLGALERRSAAERAAARDDRSARARADRRGASCAAFGDPERLLFNVNTPEDLARAEELLATRARRRRAAERRRGPCGTPGPRAAT